MTTATKEALVERELDLEARKAEGIELQVADLVFLADDPRKTLGHVARLVGAGMYVTWPRGKHALHCSADLVLVES